MNPALEGTLKHLPRRPGVYMFRDEAGEILYVGKAKVLRDRVRSYFNADRTKSIKTRELVRRIADVDTLVVDSEAEALILEANLIKEHQPRFNIQLRDDKRYPYIKVTVHEPFPRIWVTRNTKNDGSRYFGPYVSVGPMRAALDVVKRLYTVRSCRYRLPHDTPDRACLDYHIGRCKAPCVGLQSQEDYRAMIDEILRILDGDTEGLRREIEARMNEAVSKLDFEAAARYRDVIRGLDALGRRQRVEQFGGGSQDVVGIARDGDRATAVVMRIRSGLLLGKETLRFEDVLDADEDELLAGFASRFYLGRGAVGTKDLPKEVLLPAEFEDRALFEEVLSDSAGRKVVVHVPQRGEKRRLVELAETNARHGLEDRVAPDSQADRADEVLFDLQEHLNLKVVPRLMVCFDISHTQGTETVASAVVFQNAEPKKSEYRHMRIQGDWGNDDYRSMHEAVSRWFARRLKEEKPVPELCVIDGGKGQLGAAASALKEVGAGEVAVISLAKRDEEVFMPGRKEPIRIDRRDRALHVLQRIRDEAHRFAVSYNRKLRSKRTIRSELSDIPGIGPARRQALLTRFGSVKGILEATQEEIARVEGFSEVLAARVQTWLRR